jgi:glycosyltransferase involved in cell wall biosynthesis
VKVCFVASNFPPEALGGTEQVVSALARALRQRGVDVLVVSGSDRLHDGVDVEVEQHDGAPVFRLRKLPAETDVRMLVRPRLLGLLRGLLQHHRPDILHVHGFAQFGGGIAALGRELGCRVVATFHDLWTTCARFFRVPHGGVQCPTGTDRTPCVVCVNDALQTAPEVVAAGLQERDRLLRAETALLHAATAPSRSAAAFVRDCLPYDAPIEVIPHGLLRPVPADERAAPPAGGERLRIGTFGGIVPEKGVRDLVAAAAGLGCELRVAGPVYDQAFDAELQALAARDGTRLVRTGRFTAADRHPARDLHLAVFPSRCQETYGLVVDEALAHGVPVVASDHGAFRERAGSGGVVVTALAQLAAVLRELVTSPPRLAALRAAIPAALPTIAAAADRHLDLYVRLR